MYEEIKYKPLSPWAYFGYQLLFSVPVIGTVFLIIFAIGAKNINLRNFARSYFCVAVLVLVAVVAAFLLFKFNIISGIKLDDITNML